MYYEAPWWAPGGNLQTIWAAVGARHGRGTPVQWRREQWDTSDGDFIDVDFAGGSGPPFSNPAQQPLLVVFHGLEGSSASHYAQTFAATAAQRGWGCAVPHFRGCGGALNRAPRAYHSGDYEEIGWMFQRLRQHHGQGPVLAVGVSLGGNALLRWAQESGTLAAQQVRAIAAVSAPLDLAAGAKAIDTGFNRLVYTRMFLSTMKPKALAKLAQHPGLFDGDALRAARSIHAFDDAFTAPLHGFRDAVDYWRSCSAGPRMEALKLPALVLNALNDPFVPSASLPQTGAGGEMSHGRSSSKVGPATYWRPATGGHVGFPAGALPPGNVRVMPLAVCDWLSQHLR